MATAGVLSFRFSSTDGVSVVARAWIEQLRRFGFDVITIAGDGPADRIVPGLGIRSPTPPEPARLRDALADIDLTIVENLATIPLNVPAALLVAEELAGRPAILHHHDPPWQRAEWSQVTSLPPDDRAWRHVVITDATRHEFEQRGLSATVIRNSFSAAGDGDRSATRAALDVGPGELLVVHPVRAIERKGIPDAVSMTEALHGTYWLLGPAEDGYGETLDTVLGSADCRVIHRSWPSTDDIYAASDLVAYPSTWEGFGNPPIEAALRRRWTAIGSYPMVRELTTLGFTFLDPHDVRTLGSHLAQRHHQALTRNEALAREHFSHERMAHDLGELLHEAGWMP